LDPGEREYRSPSGLHGSDGKKRPVLHNRERRSKIIVEMGDSLNILPGTKYLSVEVNFSRGANTFRTGHYDTIEITDQQVVRPQRSTALIERLDQQMLTVRQPRTDMATIAKDVETVEDKCACGDLFAQFLLNASRQGWLINGHL
jgi:hypothetical protein